MDEPQINSTQLAEALSTISPAQPVYVSMADGTKSRVLSILQSSKDGTLEIVHEKSDQELVDGFWAAYREIKKDIIQ